MKCWAVVPVKPLHLAKSRLGRALSPVRRYKLVQRLLRHTLAVLREVETLGGVLVVSADSQVEGVAREAGAKFLAEARPQGLNAALAQAVAEVQARGGDAVLIVPTDLPRLCRESVLPLLALADRPPYVGLAPDRRGQGTNALLLAPAQPFPFAFGPGSFPAHLAAARALPAHVAIYHDPDWEVDLDVPADLALAEDFLAVSTARG